MIACVVIPDLLTLVESDTVSSIILVNPAGKVQAASTDAVRCGVRLKMGARQAATLCPHAHLIDFQDAPYVQLTEIIEQTLREFTTRIEPLPGFWQNKKQPGNAHPSAAMFYLDLGKLASKDGLQLAEQIGKVLFDQFNASTCIGLARNKFPAFVAARYTKPQTAKLILPGEEGQYLSHLPITLLPLGKELSRRLEVFGIKTLGELAALPAGSVIMQLGKKGRFLHQLAQGNDARPLVVRPRKPAYSLTQQFEDSIEDSYLIEKLLRQFGCDIETHLNSLGFTTQILELTLHLDNHKKQRASNTLREPTSNGKVLGRALIRLLSRTKLDCGVIAIDVTAKDLTPMVWQQMDLFGVPAAAQNRLSDLLEALTTRYGTECIYQVQVEEVDHPLAEQRFSIERVDAA